MQIESGIGNGTVAGVDEDNRLLTAAFNIPFPHLIAKDYNKTFMVRGTATPTPGGVTVLYIENTSASDVVVLNRVILQALPSGGTALPNTSAYFTLETDATYGSGGTIVSPVNLSSGSAVVSGVVAYDDGVGLGGTPIEATAIWPYAYAAPVDLELQGGVIILPGKGMAVGYNSDNTGGIVSASVAFSVVGSDGYSG